MTGLTVGDNLPYPNDYGAPADVPNDMEALAEATQVALNNRRSLLVPYTGWSRAEDIPIVADTECGITFTVEYPQASGSTKAANAVFVPAAGGKNSHTEFTIIKPGVHTLELDLSLVHGTVGTVKTIEVGIAGSGGVIASAEFSVHQATAGRSSRIALHLTQNLNGTFYAYSKPIGAAATGWTMVYARIALIGA